MVRGYKKAGDKRKFVVKSAFGLVAVIVILFLFGPFFMISPIKIGYSVIESEKAIVYYPSSNSIKGREIFEMAEQALQKNENFYGKLSRAKVLVGVSDIDMLRFGVYPKGNGGALNWGIVVRESRASWNIISHELSHKNLAQFSRFGSGVFSYPRWFDEGLASYIGAMSWYRDIPQLKEDINPGRYRSDITNWKGISGQFTWIYQTFFARNSHLIYGQSYLMVKHLFNKYGEDKVRQLAFGAAKAPFDEVFENIFGLSVEQFHQEFIQYVTQED